MTSRISRSLLLAAAALAVCVAAVPAAGLSGFSTAPKTLAGPAAPPTSLLVGVRVQRRVLFDRVVFRFKGPRPRAEVRYVDKLVQDGSGDVIAVKGSAVLRVVFRGTNAHTCGASGCDSTSPAVLTPGLRRVVQVRRAGDFEAVTTYGIGVRRKRPFRVFALLDPPRVVVDVR
jgi:hypothetical protein